MLDRMRDRPTWAPFFDSLPVAGREGTLSERMTKGRRATAAGPRRAR